MTQQQAIQINLDDGRIVVGLPGPEDQGFLGEPGSETTISLGTAGGDTSGHGWSSDIDVDVAGHAMTLRLPTPADAEALRRLLMVGAMSATIVAAGALASMQPQSVPSTQTIVNRGPVNAPAQHLEQVREDRLDQMLQAPPAISQPSDIAVDDAPAAGTTSASASRIAPSSALRPDQRSDDFSLRREQAADELLAAPPAEAPAAPDAGSNRSGGPQD